MAKPEWRKKLFKFDKSGVFWELLKCKDEIIEKLIEGEEPLEVEELSRYFIEKYDVFETEFKGWQVYVKPDVTVSTPEYLTEHFDYKRGLIKKKDILKKVKELKREGKSEWKRYAGTIKVDIAKIDELRTLGVEQQRPSGLNFGEFLTVDMEDNYKWPATKFDIRKGRLTKKGLYDFVEQLIELSKQCNIGVSVKHLWRSYGNRFVLKDMHLYPHVNEKLSKKKTIKKLLEVYDASKGLWGDAFTRNPHNNMPGFLEALEKSGRL